MLLYELLRAEMLAAEASGKSGVIPPDGETMKRLERLNPTLWTLGEHMCCMKTPVLVAQQGIPQDDKQE